jgi:lysophospholipase L1-like esterase
MVSALMWRFVLAVSLSLATWLTAAERKPVVWLIGDSTVQNRNAGLLGWGTPFAQAVDLNQVEVQNKAIGGRSSRTYYRDHWPEVRKALQPGDWLLVQFGHNDGGSLQRSTRASLKGCSEKTEEWADPKTGRKETVHTFGWYLRQFGSDAKAAGVHVVFISLIARNIWKDDKVVRAAEQYGPRSPPRPAGPTSSISMTSWPRRSKKSAPRGSKRSFSRKTTPIRLRLARCSVRGWCLMPCAPAASRGWLAIQQRFPSEPTRPAGSRGVCPREILRAKTDF